MRPCQIVTVRDYGDQYVEAAWGWSANGERIITERGESENREKNIERCIKRAKAVVRRKCMAGGLDHLLTLTYRANIIDKQTAWRNFEKFVRLIHSYIPDWKYLVIAEKQKRGSIHFHLAVKGFQDVSLLRSLWRCIVEDGNIDIQYVKSGKGLQWKRFKLAQYLAKYIGKEMETELNEKRFRSSPGITIPKRIVFLPSAISAREYALFQVEALGGKVGFVWSPEESNGFYGWACSWG